MKCEVCGKSTDLFTDTYDPVTKERQIIYLCPKHEGVLFKKIMTCCGGMKLEWEFRGV